MPRTDTSAPIAVLSPVDADVLHTLAVADGFTMYGGGRPERVAELLHEAVRAPEGRVTVACGRRGAIIGFLCTRSPAPAHPLHPVWQATELSAFEVAEPERQKGVFTAMFRSMFATRLEETIPFFVADPASKGDRESARSFRNRIGAVLGSVGFAPLPTDSDALHPSAESALFARVGRAVPGPDVDDFFRRLHRSIQASVSILVKHHLLRNLIREDLERSGFYISSVSATRDSAEYADVVICDTAGVTGRELTVRLDEGTEAQPLDGVVWFPAIKIEELAAFVRRELERRRSGG